MEVIVLTMRLPSHILLILFSLAFARPATTAEINQGQFLALCYHAAPLRAAPDDSYSVTQSQFAEQMEYLRTHGYNPVSLDDIVKAREGKKALPEKAVLLTFDDAYISYRDFVVPLLEKLGYPSVLAVVGAFIDNPPGDLPEPLMNWEQIREVSGHRFVEVVSHSYDLHKSVQYNPQGNIGSAVSVRAYDPVTKTYETEDEYRARLEDDFIIQQKVFQEKLGFTPRALVWPYGRYNSISLAIARNHGFELTFSLKEGLSDVHDLAAVNRNLVENPPIESFLIEDRSIDHFIRTVKTPGKKTEAIRAMQVDLDLVYDPDPEQMEENLGKLIDRLFEMKVNTVFLQAFADPEGTGNIKSVYFPNRVLPVRADIFSHAVHQMMIRDMTVYAWMPVLSIELPDRRLNESLKVMAAVNGKPVPASSWYRRLTPFSSEAVSLIRSMYEDLAAHSQINGILFQDDAYLTDKEDFNPLATARYRERFGTDMLSVDPEVNPELAKQWARYKTETLIGLTSSLAEGVRKYRPDVLLARNLYSAVLEDPEAEEWFAQDYELFLKNYDQVVVMAYPQMDGIKAPSRWLADLVRKAKAVPDGIDKTVFKVQTYDWRNKAWIKDAVVFEELRDILSAGGRHIAYYPDDFWTDSPALGKIKLEMSTRTYPFLP
jgi:biofilm PGA synthesis lipoprotein PgaB